MNQTLDYFIADPAGNTTILVVSPVNRTDYQRIAQLLLEHHPEAEQVGYIVSPQSCLEPAPDAGEYNEVQKKAQEAAAAAAKAGLPRMEMCGLEFCGNASRAFGYYAALQQDPPLEEIEICVSGCDYPLHVWIDADNDFDRIGMPVPEGVEEISIPLKDGVGQVCGIAEETIEGRLVHMDGISHLVITSVPSARARNAERVQMDALFRYLRDQVYRMVDRDMPAFGIMFYDPSDTLLTPIVYVRDVDTIYFEGSCASGSTATAYAMAASGSNEAGESRETYELRQPAGTLSVEVVRDGDKVTEVLLQGSITVSPMEHYVVE